jgi:hypothetical protein
MQSSVWQLIGHKVLLRTPALSASLDLMHPTEGIADLHPALSAAAGAHLLGLESKSLESVTAETLVDHYARGADIIASYAESDAWPIRVDARWQAVGTGDAQGILATIDLVVSVRTDRLDSRPTLAVVSRIPEGDVLRLADARTSGFESLRPGEPATFERANHPGCLLFRPELGPQSYAEMVHPADCYRSELSAAADGMLLIRHHLFPEELEKGVILRARIRGGVLAREVDAQLASACFAALASADPPLGT